MGGFIRRTLRAHRSPGATIQDRRLRIVLWSLLPAISTFLLAAAVWLLADGSPETDSRWGLTEAARQALDAEARIIADRSIRQAEWAVPEGDRLLSEGQPSAEQIEAYADRLERGQ